MTSAATYDLLDELFPLTADEESRIDAAPFASPRDPSTWKAFATSSDVQDALLKSYRCGAFDFRRLMLVMRCCALGCRTADRMTILGLLAEKALRIPEQERGNERHTPYPEPIQRLAAGLVKFLREERDEKLDVVLSEAIDWLIATGISTEAQPISARTLKDWYIEQRRAAGEDVSRGRPPIK